MKADATAETLPQLLHRYRTVTERIPNYTSYSHLFHSYHSTAIEGSSLTLPQIQTILTENSPLPTLPVTDQLRLIDYHKAFEQVLTLADQREPINRLAIQQTASILMQQTGGVMHSLVSSFDTRNGDFRVDSTMAGRRHLVDAHKLPAAVDSLVKEVNTAIFQLKTPRQLYDLSFKAHFQLLTLHPFGAGNGLIARLLMSYIQQYHQLPLSLIYADSRANYIKSLDASWREKSSLPIVSFMHSQLIRFLQEEIAHWG